jgi:hypothetical protein
MNAWLRKIGGRTRRRLRGLATAPWIPACAGKDEHSTRFASTISYVLRQALVRGDDGLLRPPSFAGLMPVFATNLESGISIGFQRSCWSGWSSPHASDPT